MVEVSEEIELVYKQQHILWSNVFKHLGSHVSTYELSSCLVDCIVANADKGNCAVRSALRSAVDMPMLLVKSLVSHIALLNFVALLPFLDQGGPRHSAQSDQWWFLLGFKPRPSKEYLLLSWLNFEPWELSGAQQVLNFISQLTRARFYFCSLTC